MLAAMMTQASSDAPSGTTRSGFAGGQFFRANIASLARPHGGALCRPSRRCGGRYTAPSLVGISAARGSTTSSNIFFNDALAALLDIVVHIYASSLDVPHLFFEN